MSVNSDSGSDDVRHNGSLSNGHGQQPVGDDDVCRDFLRNVCRRGKRCKYRHPPGSSPAAENGTSSAMGASSKPEPTFCHDFQNTGCHRPTCKFLHCTREEEEHFHQTGQLPQRVQQAPQPGGGGGGAGGGGGGGGNVNNNSDIPVCRDFMKGECKRGAKCKYRHLSNDFHHDCDSNHSNQRNDVCGPGPGPGPGPGRPDMSRPDMSRHDMRSDMRPDIRPHPNDMRTNNSHNNHSHGHNHNHNHSFNNFDDNYDKFDRYEYGHSGPGQNHGPGPDGPQLKRRRVDMDGYGGGGSSGGGGGGGGSGGGSGGGYDSRYGPGPGSAPSSRPVSYQYQVLEEENTALRRRVEELKKQVADLTATNEVLLEQNARLRVAKASTMSAMQMQSSQPMGPAVTLSLAGMCHSPALQAAHLNTSLTQQIALNSDMATQHALQSAAQRMAREIQQQQQQQHQAAAAAAAAPPRPPGPQPPTMGAPPTLNASVTMNPPLATLALPQNNLVAVSLPSLVSPASLQQVPPGGSMAQNLGPPSNPLVSYPIMSQDMRCAVAPSSMAH